jgi:hypothetical protein
MYLFSLYVYQTGTHKTMVNVQHWGRESTVVEALCHKLEGRGFESRWGK